MTSTQTSDIAIVYDWLDSQGGAERVLDVLADMYPEADWYTSVYLNRPAETTEHDTTNNIVTSFIQYIPFVRSNRKLSTLLYPLAFESFDFTGYSKVISISSSFSKGIITRPETEHICYMLTPTRFLWVKEDDYIKGFTQKALAPFIQHLKNWDSIAATRPDKIIAISKTVRDRIQNIYDRKSDVVYPPFDIQYWENQLKKQVQPVLAEPEYTLPSSYYLVVSRLEPYKMVDQAVRAFNSLKSDHLVVVGKGSEQRKIRALARDNIHFLKDVSDAELAYLYSHSKGLIMPQEEDFGYTSLEAQVCTCPVIAYNKGGATETVNNGYTGFLFDEQSPQGILKGIENFESIAYTVQRHLQQNSSDAVKNFRKERFIKKFKKHTS